MEDMSLFKTSVLARFPAETQQVIEQHALRLRRGRDANDAEGLIGTSKDLMETVAKTTLESLGRTYGSATDFPKLCSAALEALELHPSALQDRQALRNLAGACITIANAITSMRNSDGTGHGRSRPTDLHAFHATFMVETATAWSKWMLDVTAKLLDGREVVNKAVQDVSGEAIFHRGELSRFLEEIRLDDLSDEDQHRLGVAVGRRWNVNETFIARIDVIEPLAKGEARYPTAFSTGVVEGLVTDDHGYIRTGELEIELIVGIVRQLPDEARKELVRHLVDVVENADAPYTSKPLREQAAIRRLRHEAAAAPSQEVASALIAIADRIERLRQPAVTNPAR